MEHLSGLFIYSCAAIVVPVVLARFVVRAEWRIIRNACLIWYGFLLLAFGASASPDGFGWALIFAMFFSIPAVPIIALVLSGWNWLGRSKLGTASIGPSRPWLQRFPLLLLSPAQWSAVVVLVTGVFLGNYWYEQRDLNARADVLRPFFRLPAGTKYTSIQSINSPAAAPRLSAIVRFTEREFQSFAAQLDQAPLWQQAPPSYDGAPVEVTSLESFKWRDLPIPVHAGDTFVNWTQLSAAAIRSLRRGRVLCIALQRKPDIRRIRKVSDAPRYVAHDCAGLERTDRVQPLVLGAIDFDTRTLHMMIR